VVSLKPFIGHNKCRSSYRHTSTHLVFFSKEFVFLKFFMEIGQSFRHRILCSHYLCPQKSSHVLKNSSTNCLLSMDWWITLHSLHINVSLHILFIFLICSNFLFLSFYLIQILVLRDLTIWFFLTFFCHFTEIYRLIFLKF